VSMADLVALTVVHHTESANENDGGVGRSLLDELVRDGARAAGIAMAYKLIDAAQARWRAVNAPHLVAPVRAGATFHNGKLLERPTDGQAA
jgi:hypothetical protein